MRPIKTVLCGVLLLLSACTSADEKSVGDADDAEDTEDTEIVIENRTGETLVYFDYAPCGSDDWVETLGFGDSVPDGEDVSTGTIDPGCYDLYIEDERWCFALSTGKEVEAGRAFVWTLTSDDLNCTSD